MSQNTRSSQESEVTAVSAASLSARSELSFCVSSLNRLDSFWSVSRRFSIDEHLAKSRSCSSRSVFNRNSRSSRSLRLQSSALSSCCRRPPRARRSARRARRPSRRAPAWTRRRLCLRPLGAPRWGRCAASRRASRAQWCADAAGFRPARAAVARCWTLSRRHCHCHCCWLVAEAAATVRWRWSRKRTASCAAGRRPAGWWRAAPRERPLARGRREAARGPVRREEKSGGLED